MKCKFFLLLLLSFLPFWGQAQDVSFQELIYKKQYDAVAAQATKLTAADSANYETMSAIGQAYEGLMKYKEAYRCFRHCLLMDTTNVDALNAVARAAINFGKIAEAERCYQKVLENDSLNFYACSQLARLYYQLGDYGRATEYYHVLSSIQGENPAILAGLGDCHYKRGGINILAALELYSRAMELNPENIRIASSLINTLLQLNNGERALQVCDTALFYNPDNRQIRQNKAMALYMTKKYLESDSVFTSLLAEEDSTYLNLKYAGAARYMSGHAMDAIEPLEAAFDLDTTDVETILLYGVSLGKTYDRKRAYQLFDLADRTMQPKPFFSNLLVSFRCDILKRDRRYDEAEKLYYEAWKKNPDDLKFISEIEQNYWRTDPELFKNETRLQKAIFVKYTYLTAIIKAGKPLTDKYYHRNYLEAIFEDAFFKGQNELTLLAPDGKKSKLPVADLQAMIQRLPEMPADVKKRQEEMKAAQKKYEDEMKKKKKSGTDSIAEVQK